MKISTLILSYNCCDTIERTILGAISQDIGCEYEIVIADDNSTDGTQAIIQSYAHQNPLIIRTILRRSNIGPQENLLSALRSITGDYVAYCEGDDYWISSQKLKLQLDCMLSDTLCDLVYTDVHIYNSNKNQWSYNIFANQLLKRPINLQEHLQRKGFFAPSTWFFNHNVLRLLLHSNNTGYIDGTFYVILNLLEHGKTRYLNLASAVYTQHSKSQTNNADHFKRYQFVKGVFRIQVDFLKTSKLSHSFKHSFLTRESRRIILMAACYGEFDYAQHIASLTNSGFFYVIIYLVRFLHLRAFLTFLLSVRRSFLRIFLGRRF